MTIQLPIQMGFQGSMGHLVRFMDGEVRCCPRWTPLEMALIQVCEVSRWNQLWIGSGRLISAMKQRHSHTTGSILFWGALMLRITHSHLTGGIVTCLAVVLKAAS